LQKALLEYPWPGNVRELENIMRRYLVYQDAELLAAELTHRPAVSEPEIDGTGNPVSTPVSTGKPEASNVDRLAQAAREAESKLLLEALDAVRWNRRQAAALLNVDYKAFLYKLQKHGIVESKIRRHKAGA
jgi:two-component system response regulator AtoC